VRQPARASIAGGRERERSSSRHRPDQKAAPAEALGRDFREHRRAVNRPDRKLGLVDRLVVFVLVVFLVIAVRVRGS
jgi:hypothetical protein